MTDRLEFLRLSGRLLSKLIGEPTGKIREVRIYYGDVVFHISEKDIFKFHDGE